MSVLVVLVVIAVTLLVFLVCRELVCWYWKINEAVMLLRATAQNTATIVDTLRTSGVPRVTQPTPVAIER